MIGLFQALLPAGFSPDAGYGLERWCLARDQLRTSVTLIHTDVVYRRVDMAVTDRASVAMSMSSVSWRRIRNGYQRNSGDTSGPRGGVIQSGSR
jgi:hypothetical protein